MPKPPGDQVWTKQHRRSYLQFGGARPDKAVKFSGLGAQRTRVEGISMPDGGGGINPIWMPNPRRAGRYQLAGSTQEPPDLPEGTVIFAEELGGSIPRQFARLGCINLYEVGSPCADLSNFLTGWQGYLIVHENGRPNANKDLGNRTAYDSDEMLETTIAMTFDDIYGLGELFFGETATTQVDREVMDATYGPTTVCDDCDPDLDTQRIYTVTRSSGSASPGLPAEIQYTVNGGGVWSEKAIDGIGATEDPVAMKVVGNMLVVLTRTAGGATTGGYYWATINAKTGVPGTFTKVVFGFVAGKQPNDFWASHSGAIFFAADGGYIYRSSNIQAGVEVLSAGVATTNNLLRIKALGDTIVAVGQASTVIRSLNAGATFATTVDSTPSDIALDITAVEVMSKDHYWIGTSNSGRLIYTLNGGETWAESSFGGQGSGDIRDILFITPSVGYVAYNTTAPAAKIYTTWNGGADWTSEAPRIAPLPTADYIRRLAAPIESDSTRACNNLVAVGLAGNGTDGVVLLGVAPML